MSTDPHAPGSPKAIDSSLQPYRENFVYREGQHFKVNGRLFKHVGVNIPQLVYQPEDQLVRELNGAQACGIKQVRVLLPNDHLGRDVVKWRLERVVNEAWPNRGIRVTVALTHNYFQDVWGWEGAGGKHVVQGDGPFYNRPYRDGPMLNDQWIDRGYNDQYKGFALEIAAHFQNKAGIFAWDIANEVNVSNTADSQMVDREIAFYLTMAQALKVADPYHMVTTSAISTHWLGLTDRDRKNRLYKDTRIDYVVVHEYNDHYDDDILHQKDDIVRANSPTEYNKPVVIEEFGMSRDKFGDAVFDNVNRYYRRHYAGDNPSLLVDAILQWNVSFIPEVDTGNGHLPRDAEPWDVGPIALGLLEEFKRLWLDWSQRLDSGNEYPQGIVIDNYYIHNDARTQVSASASWTPSRYVPDFWGTGYQVAEVQLGVEDGFNFWFRLDSGGRKTVDAWWTTGPTRTNGAQFVIYNAQNQHLGTVSRNQQVDGGRWNWLGAFDFTTGLNRVVISRWQDPANGRHVIADAIRVR